MESSVCRLMLICFAMYITLVINLWGANLTAGLVPSVCQSIHIYSNMYLDAVYEPANGSMCRHVYIPVYRHV